MEGNNVIDFVAAKEKRDSIAYIENMYRLADESFETMDNYGLDEIVDQINEFHRIANQEKNTRLYIDATGDVVSYDSEGNKYRHE